MIASAGQVFYLGVDNPLTVAVPGAAPAELEIAATNATVSGSAGAFTLRPGPAAACEIEVTVKRAGGTQRAGTTTLPVQRLPDPVAYVQTIAGDGVMTRAELLAVSGVTARQVHAPIEAAFAVESYVVALVAESGRWLEARAHGPTLTGELRLLLTVARPGARVLFEQVVVRGPDGVARKIAGVVVRVR